MEASRGATVAETWIFRGGESRRRRGWDADGPLETSRGDAAGVAWIIRGENERERAPRGLCARGESPLKTPGVDDERARARVLEVRSTKSVAAR